MLVEGLPYGIRERDLPIIDKGNFAYTPCLSNPPKISVQFSVLGIVRLRTSKLLAT